MCSVIGIDSSKDAINIANKNLQLNHITSNDISFIEEDVFKYLENNNNNQKNNSKLFDIIVCDPPKFAPNKNTITQAKQRYVVIIYVIVLIITLHVVMTNLIMFYVPDDTYMHRYIRLNMLAMKSLRSGGLLFTCSCSGAIAQTESLFMDILLEASRKCNRDITILSTTSSGEDHTVLASYPEGRYLTCVLLRVS
jgi:23S rRNA G2069 N7-methylase RlmK/C1962 C5-methylase RlmI